MPRENRDSPRGEQRESHDIAKGLRAHFQGDGHPIAERHDRGDHPRVFRESLVVRPDGLSLLERSFRATSPLQSTLSVTRRPPTRRRSMHGSRTAGYPALSMSLKMKSNGPLTSLRISPAFPTRIFTFDPTPVFSRFLRAIVAVSGLCSTVTSSPPFGSARASQVPEYPIAVPNSRIRSARIDRART